MKIYFPVPKPGPVVFNHFVYSLLDGLNNNGVKADCGIEQLWSEELFTYDIVHFQWPETLYKRDLATSDSQLEEFASRLDKFKSSPDKKIFITCHNLKPHKIKDSNVMRLYDIIYTRVDAFIHMGEFSRQLLSEQYPNAKHLILPHHIYDNRFNFDVRKQDARKALRLPTDKVLVLSFGSFRNDEERNLVLMAKYAMDSSKYEFVMPGFYRKKILNKNITELITRLYRTIKYKLAGIRFSNTFLSDDDMKLYFCAADIVLIQRVDILNSGNLPMAFAAGKVVVGPKTGNVGCILEETSNPTFDINHIDTVTTAIEKAENLAKLGKGEKNREFAYAQWSVDTISKKLIEYYNYTK